MKNSIKRAQSQACLGFAERKNFRPLAKQLKKLTLTLVALLSTAAGAWAQTENEVTVNRDGENNKWTFTMPASNVELQVEYEPSYNVTFNTEGLDAEEAAKFTATPNTGVYKDQTVTVTYTGTKRLIGFKAVKKSNNPYANAQLGDLFYSDGTFSTELEAGKTPIGVIAYLDKEGTDDDEICEKSNGAGHGLVLCLKDAASGSNAQWSTENVSKFSGQGVTSVEGLKRTENVSGYTNTAALTVDDATAAKYPAAAAAKNYTGLTAPTGTTGWFLPSAQQWVKMIEGLGGLSDGAPNLAESWFDNNHEGADKWENAIKKAGNGNYDSMTSAYLYYWSSSEYSASGAVALSVDATDTGEDFGLLWWNYDKDSTDDDRVRPVLAF